jgi:ABC-2 type transport system permease protein
LGAVQLSLLFVVGVTVLDLHVGGKVPGVAVMSIALLACVVALGLAMTAVFKTAQQLNSIGFLSATVLGALGGALVPLATLPQWAQTIAPITPQYWAMRGFRALILDRAGVGAVALPALMLTSYALVFAAVAVWRFRFDDDKVGFS